LQPLDPAALAAIAAAKDRIAAHWERLRALLIGGGTASAVAVRAGLAGWVEMARPGPNDWRAFNLALDPPDDGGAAGTAAMAGPALLRACNICGGKVFAPAGQADQADLGTVCTGCGSPARHRAFRVIADALRIVGRQGGACLLFGRNRIVARGWFLSTVEVAVNATGRIGAASFACAEASADVVVCVDILDRATDYRQALRDLLRATSPGGYVLVGVRLVPGRETTMDWGFPRADRDGTYRMFGRDVVDTIAEALPAASVAVAHPVDPVSGVAVMAIVLAHAPDDLRRLLDSTVPCRLAPYPMVASR
jgi:SAM-dependent methyltransferase